MNLNAKLSKAATSTGSDRCLELPSAALGMAAQNAAMNMLDTRTVLRMINVITGMTRMPVTKKQQMDLNAELNKIKL